MNSLNDPDLPEWYFRQSLAVTDFFADWDKSPLWFFESSGKRHFASRVYSAIKSNFPEFYKVTRDLWTYTQPAHLILKDLSADWRWHRFALSFFKRPTLMPLFQMYGAGSIEMDVFREDAGQAFDALPGYMRSFLNVTAHRIRLAPRLSDIDKNHATHEDAAAGIYNSLFRYIDLPLTAPNSSINENGTKTVSYDPVYNTPEKLITIFNHEVGHGLDFVCERISHSPVMMRSYAEDASRIQLPVPDKSVAWLMPHFLSVANGGAQTDEKSAVQEAFVQIAGEAFSNTPMIAPYFPRAEEQVLRILDFVADDYRLFGDGHEFPDLAYLQAAADHRPRAFVAP